jgi:drug/metabolite transporter (DMT)-like permease
MPQLPQRLNTSAANGRPPSARTADRASVPAGQACGVLSACMFADGMVVSPRLSLVKASQAVPMATVVVGGAVSALPATALLTRRRRRPSLADKPAAVSFTQPIEELSLVRPRREGG